MLIFSINIFFINKMNKKVEIIWDGKIPYYDIVCGIANTLFKLGCNVKATITIKPEQWKDDTTYIIIPIIKYLDILINNSPNHLIFYQIEQQGSDLLTDTYYTILQNSEIVWNFYPITDNTPKQVKMHKSVSYVPFGYHPSLLSYNPFKCINIEQDIDVLFLGSSCERRVKIIEDIKKLGLKVFFGYGFSRDQHILLLKRCKIYLNIHYYDNNATLETSRIAFALAHSKCIISEPSCLDIENKTFESLLIITNDIPNKCVEYINNNEIREAMEVNLPARFEKICNLETFLIDRVPELYVHRMDDYIF